MLQQKECWREREKVLQKWNVSCNAVQLINKSRDYNVFTIWHVCLNYSVLPSGSSTYWLHFSFPSLCFLLSFAVMRAAWPELQVDVLKRLIVPSLAPLLFSFAYTASICQAVINLTQSTLLGPPRTHALWSLRSPYMSRGWWVSVSWID